MELSNISIFGNQVSVIFTGKHYTFYNHYYGFLAIAERNETDFDPTGHNEKFSVTYGNHHCIGGPLSNDRILAGVKRFIRKEETKHGAAVVEFSETYKDMAGSYLTMDRGLIIPR